jgi:hypothetical protein
MNLLRLVAGASALGVGVAAFAQSAVLHDGTILVQKVPIELFATEGPVWDLDIENRRFRVSGRYVTVPASINGVPFELGGTEVIDAEGNSLGALTAENFDRLSDSRAMFKDRVFSSACPECGPLRLGPIRSIFSTSEARGNPVQDDADLLDRMPEVQRMIEDNYFFLARNIYLQHADVLPLEWLGRIGIRDETGGFPTSASNLPNRRYWRYPATNGGTVKSAGTVYADALGNEYLIPDLERAFELSENVTIGPVRSVKFGDFSTPDSFVVGDIAVIMNQDPRFGANIIGIAGQPITREYFFANLTPGMEIAVGGFMVGEHLQMAQDIEVGMYDPVDGLVMTADRFSVVLVDGFIQFQGWIIPMGDLSFSATIAGVDFPLEVIPAGEPGTKGPLAELGRYRLRLAGIILDGVTSVTLTARDPAGVVVKTEVIEIPPETIE